MVTKTNRSDKTDIKKILKIIANVILAASS
jgi:hypothetical protein